MKHIPEDLKEVYAAHTQHIQKYRRRFLVVVIGLPVVLAAVAYASTHPIVQICLIAVAACFVFGVVSTVAEQVSMRESMLKTHFIAGATIEMHTAVTQLAERLGMEKPDLITYNPYNDDESDEAAALISLGGRYVAFSPELQTRDMTTASFVAAHELTHLRHNDQRTNTLMAAFETGMSALRGGANSFAAFAPLAAIACVVIGNTSAAYTLLVLMGVAMVLMCSIGFLLVSFAHVYKSVRYATEYRADIEAAGLTGSEGRAAGAEYFRQELRRAEEEDVFIDTSVHPHLTLRADLLASE